MMSNSEIKEILKEIESPQVENYLSKEIFISPDQELFESEVFKIFNRITFNRWEGILYKIPLKEKNLSLIIDILFGKEFEYNKFRENNYSIYSPQGYPIGAAIILGDFAIIGIPKEIFSGSNFSYKLEIIKEVLSDL